MTRLRVIYSAAILALLVANAAAEDVDDTGRQPPVSQTQESSKASDVLTPGDDSAAGRQGHYEWETVSAEQRAMEWPTQNDSSIVSILAVFGAAGVMALLAALGLSVAFRSLRAEIRNNRSPAYRPRGPASTHERA